MQEPTVIASSRMKTVLSALKQRHLHLCIKQTMDQSYLEPSHVLRETWADPYPVILLTTHGLMVCMQHWAYYELGK